MTAKAILPAALAAALCCSCGDFGQVNQGRVVSYDQQRGVVTLVSDSNYKDPENPRFDVQPAVEVHIPADPKEMGPAPAAGRLLNIDRAGRRIVVYDAASQALRSIPYTPVDEQAGVGQRDPRLEGLPTVNPSRKTVTLYSATERLLLTASLADEYLALPRETWIGGDEVRYYYKDPSQALRLMNVTRTDLTKGK